MHSAFHTGSPSVILEMMLTVKLLVRKAVLEKYLSCQHNGKHSNAPFLHIDILVISIDSNLLETL